jgi:septum formation protein
MRPIILASASPRRQALIQLLQRPVHVRVAEVDEESVTHPAPTINVIETARLKAEAVAAVTAEDALIIAADTTVALAGQMLNKPADPAEAAAMLRQLRDRTHQVHTGIAILETATGRTATAASTTEVTMRAYSDAEIAAYVATGDPLDKAGAYAIQHTGFRPVAALEGCYTGVVGLSLCRLAELLQALGMQVSLPVAAGTNDYRACPVCLTLVEDLL